MSSTSWLEAYLSALLVRDTHEQALKSAYDAYSKLADHTAAQHGQLQPLSDSSPAPTPTSAVTTPVSKPRTIPSIPPFHTPPSPITELSRLRVDLSHAQTTKATLAASVTTLTAQIVQLQATLASTSARANALEGSHQALTRKLRDREHELMGKKELLERVQDELLAAEMQVNVAEGERQRVEGENKELVKRLLKGREEEVERMNKVGGWG